MRDLTDEAPVRRMSVARARTGTVAEREQGRIEAAVIQAVHDAPRLLPGTVAFQPTHVDVLFDETGITVSIQAYARAPMTQAALLAANIANLLADGQGVEHVQDV